MAGAGRPAHPAHPAHQNAYLVDDEGVVQGWTTAELAAETRTAVETFVQSAVQRLRPGSPSLLAPPDLGSNGIPQSSSQPAEPTAPLGDDSGRFILAELVGEDGASMGYLITERLSAAQTDATTLGWSETQFRMLVDGVADYAIYMIDPAGKVVTWNTGAQRIKGYEATEIVGRHYGEFYTDADRSAGVPQNNLRRAAQEGRVEAEGWRIRKDGSRFWADVIIDRVLDAQGHLVGFAKVTRDVTEQRAANQQLEEAKEALFQAQKMEAIGQLTGGMAHDFNNLLMAIQSSLDLLQMRLPPEDSTQSLITTALAGVSRGKGLTQRMLAFARRQELRPQAVNLVDLVYGMSELIDGSVGARYQVTTRFPYKSPQALVDPHQLELALLNLVVNARDSYGQDGGLISIEIDILNAPHSDVPSLAPGMFARLSVVDDGPGMDAATLARAADPFFTTKGVGKGTGLGLSMVHGLAAQSKGQLVLRSQPGQGTRASIWLPVADGSATPPRRLQGTEHPTQHGPAPSLRVLAVDDDALVLSTLTALLEDQGHRVTAAASGMDAISLLEADDSFDLLLTDYSMPGMTGTELAAAAQQLRPGMPTVLATGYADVSTSHLPNMMRLDKPFDRASLAEALQRATAGQHRGSA